MIKLAVVDRDPQFSKEIEQMIEDRSDMAIITRAFDLNRALIIAEKERPQVMVVGPGIGDDVAIPFMRRLTTEYQIGCILLTFSSTYKLKAAAISAKVVEVIKVPSDPEKIINAIHVAAGYAEQMSKAEEKVAGKRDHKCAVITVFSTKGGVGKTVLATNMATSITKKTESRVILVDLDLQFGDVGIAMGLESSNTVLEFADYISDMGETDEKRLDELLVSHSSGLKVLLAPKEPESADLITPESIKSIMEILKKDADFIIVDTPASFDDNVLTLLDASDEICMILTMDMPSVKNLKLCFKTLSDLRYSREMQRLVINRVENNVGLKVAEIEHSIGMRAIGRIPFDKAVPLSVNKGVPVVLDAPKLQVSKEIENLAMFYVSKHRPDLAEMAEVG